MVSYGVEITEKKETATTFEYTYTIYDKPMADVTKIAINAGVISLLKPLTDEKAQFKTEVIIRLKQALRVTQTKPTTFKFDYDFALETLTDVV